MQHSIRAAAIVIEDDSVLLVQHQHDRVGGRSWWVPPGGGFEGGESLMECARRETLGETGLTVDLRRIVYIREFVEPGHHHCDVFFLADSYSGSLRTDADRGTGIFDLDHMIKVVMIKVVRFVSRGDMGGMTVYPVDVKTTPWEDLAAGFPHVRYLGVERSESKTYVDPQDGP